MSLRAFWSSIPYRSAKISTAITGCEGLGPCNSGTTLKQAASWWEKQIIEARYRLSPPVGPRGLTGSGP